MKIIIEIVWKYENVKTVRGKYRIQHSTYTTIKS